jgi:DNA repair exonuclease SbcCD ATPase subunit
MADVRCIDWIEIENFRGFADTVRFDLAASVVIASGPNGSGKTSFCDAIQWMLVGAVGHLADVSTRRDAPYVENVFRPGTTARVAAGLQFPDLGQVEVHRLGAAGESRLSWRDSTGEYQGTEAELRLKVAFGLPSIADTPAFILRSLVLQQDTVRAVLEDRGQTRYDNLVALLGLEALPSFEAAVATHTKRTATMRDRARSALDSIQRDLAAVQARLDRLEELALASPDVARAVEDAALRAAALSHLDGPALVHDFAAQRLQLDAVQESLAQIRDLAGRYEDASSRVAAITPPSQGELQSVESQRQIAQSRVQLAVDAEAAAMVRQQEFLQASEASAALARAALPLLTEICPVCQRSINRRDVQAHLESDAASTLQAVREISNEVERARQQRREAEALVRSLDAEAEEIQSRQARLEVVASEVGALAAENDRLRGTLAIRLNARIGPATGSHGPDGLRLVHDDLRSISSILEDLSSRLARRPAPQGLAHERGNLEQLLQQEAQATAALRSASAVEDEANTLSRATTRACADVAAKRSRIISPLAQNIYTRLDPHPSFKSLDFRLDVYYERGQVRPVVSDAAGVEANPLLAMSSAQMNVVALAYFLALGRATGRSGSGLTVLDDPLQSLDDVNALGFADVCRHLRAERQLILATHDRRLTSLLRRKLAPRDEEHATVVLEFQNWTPEGPQVRVDRVEPQPAVGASRLITGESAA